MSGFKKTPAEELIESLLKDVGDDDSDSSQEDDGYSSKSTDEDGGEEEVDEATIQEFLGGVRKEDGGFMMTPSKSDYIDKTESEYERTRQTNVDNKTSAVFKVDDVDLPNIPSALGGLVAQNLNKKNKRTNEETDLFVSEDPFASNDSMVTKAIINDNRADAIKLDTSSRPEDNYGDNDKTVAVAGYQARNNDDNYDDRVKVSVGQNRGGSTGYSAWSSNGSAESNLAQADNLRIAQDKIIDVETENEKLRLQNEELMAASEIIKERSDLLSSQLSEFKNDRENLEESFKNEIVLLKNHLAKKDNELQKAVLKSDELESRLKFDMKKIRVRERELENRLELIRAEKNAIVKNKDEQILDLRRKMDVLQMEVDSYRQKCIELNKSIETNQESFKRTTRALRLAMANLELQEENKVPMKKAE